MNTRLSAARVIDKVTDGESLSHVLVPELKHFADPRDRAFVQALCYGVCRYYERLDGVLSWLMPKPMKAKDSDVYALLLVGLYQLMAMRVSEHAAVSETVSAATKLKKPWARALINGVLREFLRQKAALQEKIDADEEAKYMHPAWMIQKIKAAYPTQWQSILEENNTAPPLTLRVNHQKISRDDYLKQIESAKVVDPVASAILLTTPTTVDALPGFKQGHVTVQDAAAQLAATLLQLKPGLSVLDACAAPGGKLTHLFEVEPRLKKVVAVEKDGARMQRIEENLQRLSLTNQVVLHPVDINHVDAWWDGELFDRILLDVPCSASGVIRRHPDIKLLRQSRDIATLQKEQRAILDSAWSCLKPGGLLLYVTCSVFPEENADNILWFLEKYADANEVVLHAAWGQACQAGRQILPGQDAMDGFYYCLISKALHIEMLT